MTKLETKTITETIPSNTKLIDQTNRTVEPNNSAIGHQTIEYMTELRTETANQIAPNNSQTPFKQNRYGDSLLSQLKGIVCLGVEIITRVHQWTLSQSPDRQAFA